MTHRRLRIELGINLNATTMTKTDPKKRLFPLQNTLVDITENEPKPLWYSQIRSGDELSFRLVDITDLSRPDTPPCRPACVSLVFSAPTTGDSCNPFEQTILEWKVDRTATERFSPVYSTVTGKKLPTWDLVWRGEGGQGWQRRPVTLAALGRDRYRCFEMSMALVVDRERELRDAHFVFDPEMIVSESDSDPP